MELNEHRTSLFIPHQYREMTYGSASTVLTDNGAGLITNQPGRTPNHRHRPLQKDQYFIVSIVLSFICCFFGSLGLCFLIPAIILSVQAREAQAHGVTGKAESKRKCSLVMIIGGLIAGLLHFGIICGVTAYLAYVFVGLRQINSGPD